MIVNKKRTLDNITTNSLGTLTYDEYGQFFFDGMQEETAYQLDRLIIAFLRDALITFAYSFDEPSAFGMQIVDAVPEAYKAFEKMPFTQSLVAWKDYLFYIVSKLDFISELQSFEDTLDKEGILTFYEKYDKEVSEVFDALKIILPRLRLYHD